MIVTRTEAFTDYLGWITNGGHWDDDVLEVISRRMREDANHAKGDGRGRLRPSLIGHPCDRVQILSYHHLRPSTSDWRAWIGTWMHLAFDTYLVTEWPHRLQVEYPVIPAVGALGVTGKADWYWYSTSETSMFRHISGPHLGDYKTIEKISMVEAAPLDKHLEQLGYELFTLGMTTAYLVYQVRGFGTMASYQLTLEPADTDRIAARLERLAVSLDTDSLPGMLDECKARKGLFRSCDFAQECLNHALAGQ